MGGEKLKKGEEKKKAATRIFARPFHDVSSGPFLAPIVFGIAKGGEKKEKRGVDFRFIL